MTSVANALKPTTALQTLEAALNDWVALGSAGKLARWLGRELDPDGVPRSLALEDWEPGLRRLFEARRERSDEWPEQFDAVMEGWFRATLRFSRPGGPVPASESAKEKARGVLYRGWADVLSDPGLGTVVDWWFPRPSKARHSPPPLPADARPDRALAVLRANWARDGDFVAIDHRPLGSETTFELFGGGIPWFNGRWESLAAESATRARPSLWTTNSSADVFEWTYRVGKARVTRSAVLLRGRRLALLGEQWDGPDDPGGFSLPLAEGVQTASIPDCRGFSLTPGRGRGSARVYPIGLPRLDYETERGSFRPEGQSLVLTQPAIANAKRTWRGLLVSWEPKRNRLPVHWRTLTVSEEAKECSPGTAFAARITWGRDDTLLIYRSLNRPGLRACLGHQTRSKFLVGLFTGEGEVEPLLKIDE